MAETTAEVRNEFLALTIGMFNAAPGANYLGEMVVVWEAGASVSAVANSLQRTTQFAQICPVLQKV